MAHHGLWVLREDPATLDHFSRALLMDPDNRIANITDLNSKLTELHYKNGYFDPSNPVLPDSFPHPILSLPPFDFEPDYFTWEAGLGFASWRFREALAQPRGVVQYWPIELLRASEAAVAQDYRLFHVIDSAAGD